jgi:uncharacterized protein (TIGR03118 family)
VSAGRSSYGHPVMVVPGRTDKHGKSETSGKNGPRLLAADGVNGIIDVYDGNFNPLVMPGAFVDPHSASDGLALYNVAYLKGRVYVTYATNGDPGGAVSVFTREGRFIKRLVSGAPHNGPWGLAIAPKHWGDFGGALLVGNVDSGMINAFNPAQGICWAPSAMRAASRWSTLVSGAWPSATGSSAPRRRSCSQQASVRRPAGSASTSTNTVSSGSSNRSTTTTTN